MLGAGYYVEAELATSQAHNALRIQATFYMIDNWDTTADVAVMAQLFVDGTLVWAVAPPSGRDAVSMYECGVEARRDSAFPVDAMVTHTAEVVRLKFNTTITNAADYWGISDLQVTLVTYASPTPPPPYPPSESAASSAIGRRLTDAQSTEQSTAEQSTAEQSTAEQSTDTPFWQSSGVMDLTATSVGLCLPPAPPPAAPPLPMAPFRADGGDAWVLELFIDANCTHKVSIPPTVNGTVSSPSRGPCVVLLPYRPWT